MPKARFYKTLFLPSLDGQFQLWKNDYVKLAGKVDEIVQMGNLIGCYDRAKDKETYGPNLAVLKYIALWRATYSNWTQLVGPNEIMALNFPDEWTNDESNKLLRARWIDPDAFAPFRPAAVNKNRLLTHGGLTHGEWVKLGKPETAQEAAEALNKKYHRTLYQGPSYKLTQKPNFSANPIFADPLRETYPSWITAEEACPFGQVHAGNGLNTIEGRLALNQKFSLLLHVDEVRHTNFGSMTVINEQLFLALVHDISLEKMHRHLPEPWNLYIEKIPVVDMRDELFS